MIDKGLVFEQFVWSFDILMAKGEAVSIDVKTIAECKIN